MATPSSSREFMLVVYGATGFTGQLVCEYLAQKQQQDPTITWAMAGRDREKLQKVAKDIVATNFASVGSAAASALTPKIIVADSSKPDTVDAMCKRAQIVIACAGPFALHGFPVAEACVSAGTHYVDITGEPNYVRRLVETLHHRAESNHVCIVPCCGFDSIPSDLVNGLLHETCSQDFPEAIINQVRTGYGPMMGGASGGTLASVVNVIKTSTPADYHPNAFVPAAHRKNMGTPIKLGLWYDGWLKSWTSPFFMAGINEKVVRRTNYLRDAKSSYVEQARGSLLVSLATTVLFYVVIVLFVFKPTRWLLERYVLPAPGQGPSAKTRAAGFFQVVGVCSTTSPKGFYNGRTLQVKISSDFDPGYNFTSRCIAETALAVLENQKNIWESKKTPGSLKSDVIEAGVLTPVTAAGSANALAKRFAAAGIAKFEQSDISPPAAKEETK